MTTLVCDACGRTSACVRCYDDATDQCCRCTQSADRDGWCDDCRPEPVQRLAALIADLSREAEAVRRAAAQTAWSEGYASGRREACRAIAQRLQAIIDDGRYWEA